MCANIRQNRHIYPPSIFRLHFWLAALSPYSAGSSWGLLSRKIFSNFIFLILARYLVNGFLRLNNFFIFFWIHYQLVLIILRFLFFFWFSLVSLRSLDWNYFFEFYTRYSYLWIFFYFFRFSFWLSNINYRFDSLQVLFDIYSFDFRYILLASISTCFSIVYSMFYLFCLL